MTREQIEQWKVERDIARKSGDPALMQAAYDHRDDLMMDCISHQSERVKKLMASDVEIRADITTIKADLAPCISTDKEIREGKLKFAGAKWAFGAVVAIASVFGPIIAIKVCKVIGVLW